MSTQEQATFIGQELERKLSIYGNYSIFYDNITDGEDFYVDVEPKDGNTCITNVAVDVIMGVLAKYHLKYFIFGTYISKPKISIY